MFCTSREDASGGCSGSSARPVAADGGGGGGSSGAGRGALPGDPGWRAGGAVGGRRSGLRRSTRRAGGLLEALLTGVGEDVPLEERGLHLGGDLPLLAGDGGLAGLHLRDGPLDLRQVLGPLWLVRTAVRAARRPA